MEVKKVIIIMRNDMIGYPPTISLVKALLSIGKKVEYVGLYSDAEGKKVLETAGVEFVPIIYPNSNYSKNKILNFIKILRWQIRYKRAMKKYLSSMAYDEGTLFWIVFSNATPLFSEHLRKRRYLLHFYEFENPRLSWKSRLAAPFYDADELLQGAEATIHCEYNRAMILNGINGIVKPTYILPNKPYDDNNAEPTADEETGKLIASVRERIVGRKAILYQGIFNTKERRLDEFCQAMKLLGDDYVFIIMGKIGKDLDYIKEKYSYDNILFIPFVRPPYHLQITKLAHIGIITYRPQSTSLGNVVNTYYCAPNKIFEYSKFGIPMISNELPGLKQIYERFGCGSIIEGEMTPSKIAKTIRGIDRRYDEMSKGSEAYFSSVDFKEIVQRIVS